MIHSIYILQHNVQNLGLPYDAIYLIIHKWLNPSQPAIEIMIDQVYPPEKWPKLTIYFAET